MPDASRRQRIITTLQSRLETIQVRNDFATNAGRQIFINETPTLGPEDPDDAIAMLVRDDVIGHQAEKVVIELPIEFQALARVDLDQPWLTVEAVLADLKRALELADRTLGGLVLRQFVRGTTRTLDREDGSLTVGVGLTYLFPYAELWGAP